MAIKTIEWRHDTVRMIDQRLLPAREIIRVYRDWRGVAEAIRTMVIRGAPAIGVAAAMGVVRAAREAGKKIAVIADETRPFLQGARLTAWELHKDRIPVTVIADNMAASVLRSGSVSCIVVGTDRTAANGDVANKIGTYPLAVMAN